MPASISARAISATSRCWSSSRRSCRSRSRLGLWMTLLSYAISIPLGIKKAVRDGSSFDIWTSAVVIIGYAIPGFLFAILLIVLFAGGSFWQVFPLRGLTSENWDCMPWYWQDRRLLLAHRPADHRHGARRLRHLDPADEELLPRRDPQAIRAHRAHEGPVRAPGALRPRVPQCDADRDRRLSRAPSSAPSSPARC